MLGRREREVIRKRKERRGEMGELEPFIAKKINDKIRNIKRNNRSNKPQITKPIY